MITNDFIRGYIQALNELDNTLSLWIQLNASNIKQGFNVGPEKGWLQVKTYVTDQKANYKKLVEELNEKSKS